jgi:hypothetical protein
MSYGRMEKKADELRREIADLLRVAEATDRSEDTLYGKGVRGDELPAELSRRESRLAKIESAMRELEAEAKSKEDGGDGVQSSPKPSEKAQRNFTDPESRIMQDGSTKEFLYAYNAQAVVDSQCQVIVAPGVTQSSNDFGCGVPMLLQAMSIAGEGRIEKVSMDAGYGSAANIEALESMGLDVYASVSRQKHGEEDVFPGTELSPDAGPRERMRHKLSGAAGKAVYKMRKAIVEPVFGHIKGCLGFRRFNLRGFANAGREWSLVCAVHNLLKLYRHGVVPGGTGPAVQCHAAGRTTASQGAEIFAVIFRCFRTVA